MHATAWQVTGLAVLSADAVAGCKRMLHVAVTCTYMYLLQVLHALHSVV
jgi:hypothetical protein